MLICHQFRTCPFLSINFECVKKPPFYSISFDESLNEIVKKQQMGVVVSYWDCSTQKYCVQYLTSKFPKYCSAEDLNFCLNEALKELDLSKMIQLSMDGPHVVGHFMRLFLPVEKKEICLLS